LFQSFVPATAGVPRFGFKSASLSACGSASHIFGDSADGGELTVTSDAADADEEEAAIWSLADREAGRIKRVFEEENQRMRPRS